MYALQGHLTAAELHWLQDTQPFTIVKAWTTNQEKGTSPNSAHAKTKGREDKYEDPMKNNHQYI